MPDFTIETTRSLPLYRQRTYRAETVEQACQSALEDDDWSDHREDREAPGPVHITDIWTGSESAYRTPGIPIPEAFSSERGGRNSRASRRVPNAASTSRRFPVIVAFSSGGDVFATERHAIEATDGKEAVRLARERAVGSTYSDPRIPDLDWHIRVEEPEENLG